MSVSDCVGGGSVGGEGKSGQLLLLLLLRLLRLEVFSEQRVLAGMPPWTETGC
jgi:hypothetical protein